MIIKYASVSWTYEQDASVHEEVTMNTPNVTNPTKDGAQVLGRNPASESRTPPARAMHLADAIAPGSTRRLADRSSTVKKVKAYQPTRSMREILDESAHIYSEFCKSRR
jgi:hypothetical protein